MAPLDDRAERGVEAEGGAEIEDLLARGARESALLLEALTAAERARVPAGDETRPGGAVAREGLEERVADVAGRDGPVEIEKERVRGPVYRGGSQITFAFRRPQVYSVTLGSGPGRYVSMPVAVMKMTPSIPKKQWKPHS